MWRNLWYILSPVFNNNNANANIDPQRQQQIENQQAHQLINMGNEMRVIYFHFARRPRRRDNPPVHMEVFRRLPRPPPLRDDADALSDSEADDDDVFIAEEEESPRPRSAHTLPRSSEDVIVSQPLLWQAREALDKEQRLARRRRRRAVDNEAAAEDTTETTTTRAAGIIEIDAISNPAEFMANYLYQNMTLDDFYDGNQPRYGPDRR